MRRNPAFYSTPKEREYIQEFRGYNARLRIANNEFHDIVNMSSWNYPVLSTRPRRNYIRDLSGITGIIYAGDNVTYSIEGTVLQYNGDMILGVPQFNGDNLRTIVQMGAYLIIFPDKVYVNTKSIYFDATGYHCSDCGYMEQVNTADNGVLTYSLCKQDGTTYTPDSVGVLPPSDPVDGTMWLDTSGEVSILKEWSDAMSMWIPVPTTYVRLDYTGIGTGFSQYDGVTVTGCAGNTGYPRVDDQINALNGSHILYAVDDDYIVFTGIFDPMGTITQTVTAANPIVAARRVPEMDYVTEYGNRLWGCSYRVVDGKTVNEIYCCALGDFKNWEKYEGVSTDSWRGSVGTPGFFTGAVTFQNHPIFFKEDRLYKIYVSAEGAHQIVDTQCRGVAPGCEKSLCVIDEVLYYKSVKDICAYDGSLPVGISDVLGDISFYNYASAGYRDYTYYICMQDGQGLDDPLAMYRLYTYDTKTGIWHRESIDGTVVQFVRDHTDLLMWVRKVTPGEEPGTINKDEKYLATVFNMRFNNHMEDPVAWTILSGVQGYDVADYKYTSRYNLRLQMPRGSSCDVYIRYDDDEDWQHQGHLEGPGTKPFTLPIRPRRCDHWQWMIDGNGECHIYSMARILDIGSDAVHGYDY